ncbi:FAD-binding type 2 [Penicillium cf. griseofulvum]|uniref:FAD-binding type 2 n=1 Tax=Penicillium cf. griseofulvum TaxID=2972120 RepID=A0A9W9M936_9EURO|nr:FAD-binding type 2 [Penicillium cf. griseofulvum]KAJ5447327.1 FAD-binding type 2 [Penicillium cf. griseofulvum]
MGEISLEEQLLRTVGSDASLVTFPVTPEGIPVFNRNIPLTPKAITFPQSVEQVAEIVKCAAAAGYKVQPRSGGHSYANHGYGGVDGAVVVDLKNLQKLSIDKSSHIATFGAGAHLGDIARFLYKHGRAMAHGTCPDVGIGGHATTGGMGPASRQWGLAIDQILEMQVVLADGQIVKTSQTEHEDLFFALRGAGASFGIVTEFVMRTQPAPTEAVQYEYVLESTNPVMRSNAFKAWQKLVADPALPVELHSMIDIFEHKIVISGTFFGTRESFDALDLDTCFPDIRDSKVSVISDWMQLVDGWANHVLREFGGGVPRAFYAKSLNFNAGSLLPSPVVDTLFHFLSTWAQGRGRLFLSFHLGGGAIVDVPAGKTAYPYRDTLFWGQFAVAGMGVVPEKSQDFVSCIVSIITGGMPNGVFGAYAGHVDPSLRNPQEAYWGPSLPRLRKIKTSVDPQDVFHNPQSVAVLEPGV